ncbi:hypothetical protein GcM1_c1389o26 [Golovinomyces cichoracearum]|uniref:Uncharacterized protein n=1 Tax=Golovinomyces cichoracearum TaxID=62708 RepID=A0A420ILQ3_9PEZI|nr:hypothetical protein GcM1_c1389o26 [Golovinomyces cichoracearum]
MQVLSNFWLTFNQKFLCLLLISKFAPGGSFPSTMVVTQSCKYRQIA